MGMFMDLVGIIIKRHVKLVNLPGSLGYSRWGPGSVTVQSVAWLGERAARQQHAASHFLTLPDARGASGFVLNLALP